MDSNERLSYPVSEVRRLRRQTGRLTRAAIRTLEQFEALGHVLKDFNLIAARHLEVLACAYPGTAHTYRIHDEITVVLCKGVTIRNLRRLAKVKRVPRSRRGRRRIARTMDAMGLLDV